MKIKFIPLLIVFGVACGNSPSAPVVPETTLQAGSKGYSWTELTAAAAFPKGYNFQLMVVRDTIWALHHDFAWFSVDGKTWVQSGLTNIIHNNAFLDYIWFNNALYGLGSLDGNIEHYELKSVINRTTDMRHWEPMAATSNLPRRFFYHPFVFRDKIWIIGGNDGKKTFADIWNSSDAVHWEKIADHLPFGERENSQFVFFNNRVYMLNSDVWSSGDGISWRQETSRIIPEDLFGYAPVVFDQKIWLMGCNRNGIFKSEVLVSEDGKKWTAERAPWTPRGGMAACFYHDKVFMTGGKYGGPGIKGQTEFVYSNDVWTLAKK